MKSDELQAKFDGIKSLVELKTNNPGLDLKHILTLIETMLTNRKGSIITDEEQDELSTIEPIGHIESKTKMGLKKEDYSMKYELIGQSAEGWYKGSQYDTNPYNVKVAVFDRCFKCKKVAIIKLTTQVEKDPTQTVVYKIHSHYDGTGHYKPLETFKGKRLNWGDILKIKEKKK